MRKSAKVLVHAISVGKLLEFIVWPTESPSKPYEKSVFRVWRSKKSERFPFQRSLIVARALLEGARENDIVATTGPDAYDDWSCSLRSFLLEDGIESFRDVVWKYGFHHELICGDWVESPIIVHGVPAVLIFSLHGLWWPEAEDEWYGEAHLAFPNGDRLVYSYLGRSLSYEVPSQDITNDLSDLVFGIADYDEVNRFQIYERFNAVIEEAAKMQREEAESTA